MKVRHVLAVIAGCAISLVLTLALSVVMGVVLVAFYASTGMLAHSAGRHADFAQLSHSPPLLLASLGVGGFAMMAGGFFAGWIARSAQVMVGFGTGILSVLISIPFFFWYPLWYNIACVFATIAPAAMGGFLARIFVGQRASAPAQGLERA